MKEQLKMIFFVFVLGIAAAGILLGSDTFTKPMIEEYEEFAFRRTILRSFDIDYEDDTVFDIFEKEITVEELDDANLYFTADGTVGFEFEGGGLWGPIRGFMTLEPDYVTIKGIQITYNEETPGLGGVVAEQWYLNKYKGKQFSPEIMIKKNADESSATEVDAITGATGTSDAFQLIINESYQARKGDLE